MPYAHVRYGDGCKNLTYLDLRAVTNIVSDSTTGPFYGCTSLRHLWLGTLPSLPDNFFMGSASPSDGIPFVTDLHFTGRAPTLSSDWRLPDPPTSWDRVQVYKSRMTTFVHLDSTSATYADDLASWKALTADGNLATTGTTWNATRAGSADNAAKRPLLLWKSPTITIDTANSVDADEGKGGYGYFLLTRGDDDPLETTIPINFAIGGTATPGQTYCSIYPDIDLKAGEKSVKVKIRPLNDPETTADTTVTLTLDTDPNNYYTIGATSEATLNVKNAAKYGGYLYADAGKWNLLAHMGNTGLGNVTANTPAAAKYCVDHGYAFEVDVQWDETTGVLYLDHDAKSGITADWTNTFQNVLKVLPTGAVFKVDAKCSKYAGAVEAIITAIKEDKTNERAFLAINYDPGTMWQRIHQEFTNVDTWSYSGPGTTSDPAANAAARAEDDLNSYEYGHSYAWNEEEMTDEFFAEFNKRGIAIDVWTIEDPRTIKELINRGARYITTNNPFPVTDALPWAANPVAVEKEAETPLAYEWTAVAYSTNDWERPSNALSGGFGAADHDGNMATYVEAFTDKDPFSWTFSEPMDLTSLTFYSLVDGGRPNVGFTNGVEVQYSGSSDWVKLPGSERRMYDQIWVPQALTFAGTNNTAFATNVVALRVQQTLANGWAEIAEVVLLGTASSGSGSGDEPEEEDDPGTSGTWTTGSYSDDTYVEVENRLNGGNGTFVDGNTSTRADVSTGNEFEYTFAEAKDITDIRIYSSWGDTGRVGFKLSNIQVKYSGSDNFVELADTGVDHCSSSSPTNRLYAALANAGGYIATNVVAVKIVFEKCQNDQIGVAEIEIAGTTHSSGGGGGEDDPDDPDPTPTTTWTTGSYSDASYVEVENRLNGGTGNMYDGVSTTYSEVKSAAVHEYAFDGAKDITDVRIYSYWEDKGRVGFQLANLQVKYNGDADYVELSDTGIDCGVSVAPTTNRLCAALSNSGGYIATNVVAVKIVFTTCQNGYIGVSEIEVAGTTHSSGGGGDDPDDPDPADPDPEESDHWTLDVANKTLTWGGWVFGTGSYIDTVNHTFSVAGCTVYPDEISPLDFSLPVKTTNDVYYTIIALNTYFVGAPVAASRVGELTLPGEGLLGTGNEAFTGCTNATGVLVFPSTLWYVSGNSFKNCKKLSILGSSMATIKSSSGNSVNYTIGDSFRGIGFSGEVYLPLIENVASEAFEATTIGAVRFGPSLKKIAYAAFWNCTKLTNVVFDANSMVLIETGDEFAYCKALEDIDLSAVTNITCGLNQGTFNGCSALTNVTLGANLESLASNAFYKANALQTIRFKGLPPANLELPFLAKLPASQQVTTIVSDKLIATKNASNKSWNDYAAGGVVSASGTTWAAEYLDSDVTDLTKRQLVCVHFVPEIIDDPDTPTAREIPYRALPTGYTQVEWLMSPETSGNWWINTGVKTKATTFMDLDFMMYGSFPANFCGQQVKDQPYDWRPYITQSRTFYDIGNYRFDYATNLSLDTRYRLQMGYDGNKLVVAVTSACVNVYSSSASLASAGSQILEEDFILFGCKGAYSVGSVNAKVWSCVLKDDGDTERDFVPAVRTSDSEPGLYDTVSGEFFADAGSGSYGKFRTGDAVLGVGVTATAEYSFSAKEWTMTFDIISGSGALYAVVQDESGNRRLSLVKSNAAAGDHIVYTLEIPVGDNYQIGYKTIAGDYKDYSFIKTTHQKPVGTIASQNFTMTNAEVVVTLTTAGELEPTSDLYFAFAKKGAAMPALTKVATGMSDGQAFTNHCADLDHSTEYDCIAIFSNSVYGTTLEHSFSTRHPCNWTTGTFDPSDFALPEHWLSGGVTANYRDSKVNDNNGYTALTATSTNAWDFAEAQDIYTIDFYFNSAADRQAGIAFGNVLVKYEGADDFVEIPNSSLAYELGGSKATFKASLSSLTGVIATNVVAVRVPATQVNGDNTRLYESVMTGEASHREFVAWTLDECATNEFVRAADAILPGNALLKSYSNIGGVVADGDLNTKSGEVPTGYTYEWQFAKAVNVRELDLYSNGGLYNGNPDIARSIIQVASVSVMYNGSSEWVQLGGGSYDKYSFGGQVKRARMLSCSGDAYALRNVIGVRVVMGAPNISHAPPYMGEVQLCGSEVPSGKTGLMLIVR